MNLTQSLYRAFSFIFYFFTARRRKKSKSTFVQKFIDEVVRHENDSFSYQDINSYRTRLLADKSEYLKKDFGSGKSRSVVTSKEAASSSISTKYGELLSRICRFQQPKKLLELGTCLGVSSLYITQGSNGAEMVSLEGCKETFAKRADNMLKEFEEKSIENIDFMNSNFDSYLQNYIGRFDTIFIDGNHTYKATLSYFERFWWRLPHDGLLIFDDIHWSYGMNKAWREIKNRPDMVSIDLYQFGLCFKRKSRRGDYTFYV